MFLAGAFLAAVCPLSVDPPAIPNVTSFIALSATDHGGGTANPGIPSGYAAPTGTQKDMAVACLVNSVGTTVPTMPSGQGWTSLTSQASANRAFLWIWKWLETGSEGFGTPANATRAVCFAYRFSNVTGYAHPFAGSPPTGNPSHALLGLSGTVFRHTGHTLIQPAAHIAYCSLLSGNMTFAGGATGHRSGAVDTGYLGTTGGRTYYGRSNGPVSAWASQDIGFTTGTSECLSGALEIAA